MPHNALEVAASTNKLTPGSYRPRYAAQRARAGHRRYLHPDQLNERVERANSACEGQDGWRTPMIEDPEHHAYHFEGTRSEGFSFDRRGMSTTTKRREDGSDANKKPDRDVDDGSPKNLTWPQRMQHVTWAWFTLTMATGGIANVLHNGT
jgi:hypothetical protein